MICSKCGKEIADGSKFCLHCGTPTVPAAAPVAEPAPEPVPVPAAEPVASAPVAAPAKPKANIGALLNKYKWILIAVVALVLVAVVAVVIISSIDKELQISNYLILEEEGYESLGHATYQLDHVSLAMYLLGEKDMLKYGDYDIDLNDEDELEDWEDDIKDEYGKDKAKAVLKFCESIEVSLSYGKGTNNGSLTNGDVITVELEWDEDRAEELNLKILDTEFEHTVSKLTPIAVIDVFEYCDLITEGFDSMGRAYVSANTTADVEVGDLVFHFIEGNSDFYVDYAYPGEDYIYNSYWYFYIDSYNYDLSNGDVLTICCSCGMWEEELIAYGAALAVPSVEMTVTELEGITAVDLLSNLTVEFSGMNGYGNPVISYVQEVLELEGFTFDFTTERIYENGDYVGYFGYSISSSYYLSNDDTIDLEIWMSSDMYYDHGLELESTNKEFTVSGLAEYLKDASGVNDNILPLAEVAKAELEKQLENDWNYLVHRWWYSSEYPEILEGPTLEKVILTVDSGYWANENDVWFIFKATLNDENLDAPTDFYFAITNSDVAITPSGEILQTKSYMNYTYGYDSYDAFWNEQISTYYDAVYEIELS